MANPLCRVSYTDNIQSLWKEAKNYLELQKEYLKLDAAERLSVLLSAAATASVCIILALGALFSFAVAFALWLRALVGGTWSAVITGGILLLLIALILTFRRRWIVQPIARFVCRLIVGEDEKEDEP